MDDLPYNLPQEMITPIPKMKFSQKKRLSVLGLNIL